MEAPLRQPRLTYLTDEEWAFGALSDADNQGRPALHRHVQREVVNASWTVHNGLQALD